MRGDRLHVKVAVFFRICFALVASTARGGPLESNRSLLIGVLASLTGSWSTLGQNTVAGLQFAIERLDADASRKSDARVRLFVRDTNFGRCGRIGAATVGSASAGSSVACCAERLYRVCGTRCFLPEAGGLYKIVVSRTPVAPPGVRR